MEGEKLEISEQSEGCRDQWKRTQSGRHHGGDLAREEERERGGEQPHGELQPLSARRAGLGALVHPEAAEEQGEVGVRGDDERGGAGVAARAVQGHPGGEREVAEPGGRRQPREAPAPDRGGGTAGRRLLARRRQQRLQGRPSLLLSRDDGRSGRRCGYRHRRACLGYGSTPVVCTCMHGQQWRSDIL